MHIDVIEYLTYSVGRSPLKIKQRNLSSGSHRITITVRCPGSINEREKKILNFTTT